MLGTYIFDLFSTEDQEWNELRSDVLQRDDYTCQRCNHKSGPHANWCGRELHAHHIIPKSVGGNDSMNNLVTLCRPCHGVQHPDNSTFDDSRLQASFLPHPNSHPEVAWIASDNQFESIEEYLDRCCRWCSRCGRCIDRSEMFLYPVYSSSSYKVTHHSDRYRSICKDCGSLVLNFDSRFDQESSHKFISCEKGDRSVSILDIYDRDSSTIPFFSFDAAERLRVYPNREENTWKYICSVLGFGYLIAVLRDKYYKFTYSL